LHTNLKGQQITIIDSIEKKVILTRPEDDFGMNMFSAIVQYKGQKYNLRCIDDRNKKVVDSIDIVDLFVHGNQQITSKSYPFKKSSLIFQIDSNLFLSVNKINPFDSTVLLKVVKGVQKEIDDAFITAIPNIIIANFFTEETTNLKKYISENKGEKIIFHFWSSFCSPCIKELPLLKELTKRGYLVVSFCDKGCDKKNIQQLLSDNNIKEPQFIGDNDEIENSFNQSGYPQFILFEPNEKYPHYFRGIEEALDFITDSKNKK
jgi:thiol-disulfide isomerase/thioredoxin